MFGVALRALTRLLLRHYHRIKYSFGCWQQKTRKMSWTEKKFQAVVPKLLAFKVFLFALHCSCVKSSRSDVSNCDSHLSKKKVLASNLRNSRWNEGNELESESVIKIIWLNKLNNVTLTRWRRKFIETYRTDFGAFRAIPKSCKGSSHETNFYQLSFSLSHEYLSRKVIETNSKTRSTSPVCKILKPKENCASETVKSLSAINSEHMWACLLKFNASSYDLLSTKVSLLFLKTKGFLQKLRIELLKNFFIVLTFSEKDFLRLRFYLPTRALLSS